jgi:hypothetical protein
LQNWVDEGSALPEKRAEAAKLITDARRYSRSTLDLSGLGLTTLPGCIGELAMLKKLILNDNLLRNQDVSIIGQWKQLEHLELCNNLLTSPPDDLKKIPFVDVSRNRLLNKTDSDRLRKTIAPGLGGTHPPAGRTIMI